MASLGYTSAWNKSQETAFRNRLRVALTRHAQYQIQRPRHGNPETEEYTESAERYEALQDLSRVVLTQVRQPDWLTSAGLYVVLPWVDTGDAVDDDEVLDLRVATVFPDLGAAPIVSP